MNTIKNNNKKLIINETKNNATLLLIAIICAVAAWFIVAMTIYPAESKTIANITLKTETTGTSAAENGLFVTNKDVEKVTVSFDCSRTDYSRINAEDIEAYVDFDNITTEGIKTLTIKARSTNGTELSNLKVKPSIVQVELDKYDMKSISVKPRTDNITVAEGKIFGNKTCEPAEITLTGPSAKLAKIAECYAVSDKSLPDLDTSYSGLTSDRYVYLDADGQEIDHDFITADPSTVNISVPVLTQKTVPFKVNLKIPSNSNFDKDSLDFIITPSELTIASGSSDVTLTDAPLEIPIALSTLDIGYSKDFSVENMLASKNVTTVSGIETVNVTLNDEGLASKEITLLGGNVGLLHVPSDGYNYSIVTETLTVKIIGPADVIKNITAADLDAEVNLLGEDTSKNPDQFAYNVNVSCRTHNDVWCVNAPDVNILKTLKTGVTTQAAASSSSTTKTN